jgi:hypothetical protein
VIFKERFWTIERVFAWEDKFRGLLLRFERISGLHYAFKTLAYTMINLRALLPDLIFGRCRPLVEFRSGAPRRDPACPRHAIKPPETV